MRGYVKGLADLLDQDPARDQLKADIEAGRVKHAYLLLGQAGIGKKTAALAFAKALFCQDRRGIDACHVCPSCRLMDHENHPHLQVMEPEDKKNYRLEDLRALQASLGFKQEETDYQLVIIDQAERLGSLGGNALLKLLEDPPPRTIFFLLATSADLLLETLLSRCQVLPMSPLSPQTVRRLLAEEAGLDENKASLLASMGQGSMDALNYLEDLEDLSVWLDLEKILDRLARDPLSSWKLAETLEKEEQLQVILAYWRNLLRDVLMDALGVKLSKRTGQKSWSAKPQVLEAMIEALGQAMDDLKRRANKRLTLDVLFQVVVEALGQGGDKSPSERRYNGQ